MKAEPYWRKLPSHVVLCPSNQWTKGQLEDTYRHVAAQVADDMQEFGAFEVNETKFKAKVMRSILDYAWPAGVA